MIDFKELSGDVPGEALEHLVRSIGQKMGLTVHWTGRGADQGRDLLFTEISKGPISQTKIVWLVSCKDKAKGGKSVSEDDLPRPGISDKLRQHKADRFLLVTTTTVSVGAKASLDGLNEDRQVRAQVWDREELAKILLRPENLDLLKQYLHQSYERVSRADSLETALFPFRDQLPEHVFTQVLHLVQPYTGVRLKGKELWPYDSDEAEVLDQIIVALLIQRDYKLAVERTNDIGFDALTPLLEALNKDYPKDLYRYVYDIIHEHQDRSLGYNAFQFLSDNVKLSRGQVLDFSSWVEDIESLIKLDEVELFVDWALNDSDSEHHNDIMEAAHIPFRKLGYKSFMTGIETEDITYQVDRSTFDRVEFFGSFKVRVKADGEGKPLLKRVWSGEFSGFFNYHGIFMSEATLDGADEPLGE